MKPTLESIIQSIPAWRGAMTRHSEPLNGGFSNDTYKVQVDGELFALRINGTQNEFLQLDRALEVEAVQRGFEMNVAPEPLYCAGRSDVLITRFLAGHPVTPEEAHDPAMQARMVQTMKVIHGLQGPQRQAGPFEIIDRYLGGASRLGVAFPDGLDRHLRRMRQIERERSRAAGWYRRYCHNDFFIFNMIYNQADALAPAGLRLIDWEMSGWGDIFLDLATVPYTNNFTIEEEQTWLEHYFGACDPDLLHALHDMRYVSLIREAAWALLSQAIVTDPVNHQMNYLGFARYVVTRLDAGKMTLFGE
jgi:thiamine kinase-like enzyme